MKNSGWFTRNKTRNRVLIVILVLSLVIVFGIMITSFNRTYRNVRSDVIELSKSSSAQNAESMELFFTRHEDVLLATTEVIEYSLSNENTGNEEIQTLLHNMSVAYNESIYKNATGKEFTGIYAAVDGVLIHGFKSPNDLPPGYNPLERQWYEEAVEGGGKVVFGEPYYDIYDSSVMVMTATKLLKDGKTVIGMDITLDDLQSAGGNMDVTVTLNGKRHDYGHGFILTGQGNVMAHWNESEQGKNYTDPNSPMYDVFQKIKECADSDKDYLETYIDGVNYGIFPEKLNNGWYVVTLTDLEDIRTTISDFAILILIGMAIIIVIGTGYCILILRAYIKEEKLTANLKNALEMAKIDALTCLDNRASYDMRVRELQEQQKTKNDISFALIMMDLNDLKYINDHYGHATGDTYILNCCKLLHSIFESRIYRIGGDEFAVFLTGKLFERWEELFDRLKYAVAEANMLFTPQVDKPSISVGMSIHLAGNDDTIDELLRKADAEMYTNKVAIKQARLEQSEKGYTPDLKLKLQDKQLLVSEMQKGLDEEQFEVWFQPQINHANNGALIGAEALVRWRHPTRGMISPAVFIPMFEYNGLIYELDKYVWKHACACIRKWIDDGMSPLPISVNISRLDIIQTDFIEVITSIVEEHHIPYELMHLEVTESAFSDDADKVATVVRELIDRGFTVAIDDFGSGYSSLSLLRRVPAHIVKLDMRFFADGEEKTRNECIVESIIRMVKMLGMAVLAEGVEYIEQADRLRSLGCAYIQGYLYSKPLPYTDYVEYVRSTVSERINHSDDKNCEEKDTETEQSQKLFHNIISGTNDVIIVVDSKTRQLLYANRAAEEFFGKRFDPLHPTTCIDYCERGEICKNCPANDMKPGERREFVTSENGSHLKSLYTQMDWNGHDAFVFYQTDISAEMREMEFANSVMDNLGMGIVIFRGDKPDELIPVFCNEEFMQLSGLGFEEFKDLVTKENRYGVQPDDIAEARTKFAEAFQNNRPMQHHLRVKKPNDKYEWVSMHANIRHLETGGYEAYTIFVDAEEEVREMVIDSERYENYIARTSQSASKSLSVTHFNLTKNTCHNIHRDILVNHPPVFNGGVDEFVISVEKNVSDEKLRAKFISKFNRVTLEENFERGVFAYEMQLPIRLLDQRIIWCYQAVKISKNPISGDLEAIMTLTEGDKDIRLEEYYRRIIQTDYEIVGNINTETGLVTIISEPVTHGLPKIRSGAVSYMEYLYGRIAFLVDEAYVDSCMEALSMDTVIEKLKLPKDYICAFPVNPSLMGEQTAFRWRFGYVNESKTEILFSRREWKGFS